ncbi:hypothetical protein XENOCAPTIV_012508 [Xenoophorus captivus]|uniref:Uncharacterized protein n=1 Tax=Xenoophorus captivus TaxID=1517983 RepID=A0ABV0QSV4_9TELE
MLVNMLFKVPPSHLTQAEPNPATEALALVREARTMRQALSKILQKFSSSLFIVLLISSIVNSDENIESSAYIIIVSLFNIDGKSLVKILHNNGRQLPCGTSQITFLASE